MGVGGLGDVVMGLGEDVVIGVGVGGAVGVGVGAPEGVTVGLGVVVAQAGEVSTGVRVQVMTATTTKRRIRWWSTVRNPSRQLPVPDERTPSRQMTQPER